MEWVHLEPAINISASNEREKEREICIIDKKSNEKDIIHSDVLINSLKRENIRLRRIIKRLKFRLKARQVCKKRSSKKNKKQLYKI